MASETIPMNPVGSTSENGDTIEIGGTDETENDNDGKRTALHEAALEGEEEVVKTLLESGAHIKHKDSNGNTALHFAVQSPKRAFGVIKLLLPPKKILEQLCGPGTVPKTFNNGERVALSKSQHWLDEATSVNREGFNVLDLALTNITTVKKPKLKDELRSIVQYIVREVDLSCLLILLRNKTGKTFNTPFRVLLEKMPEIAVEVMNKCITKKGSDITFHYEVLDDTYLLKHWPKRDDYLQSIKEHRVFEDTAGIEAYTDCKTKMKTNHPLWLMINEARKDNSDDGIYQQLLDHPLVVALVSRKWNHIGKKFHAMNFLFYMVYLFVYTWCVSTTAPPHIHSQNTNITINPANTTYQNTATYVHKTTLGNIEPKAACDSYKGNGKSAIVDMQYLVISISVIMILKEFYQLVVMYKCEYFKQTVNYVELAVYISSILFVVNVSDCEKTDYRTNWQWILGTFSILLAWTNVLTYARKTYFWGTYALMLWTISKKFLTRVLPLCAVLLIAFAIAFHCVLQSQGEFENFWHSVLVTSSFLVSGFEYGEFQAFVDKNDLAPVGYIIYSLFIVTTIIVLNLVVGEAVENVEQIHKLACNTRFALQINYVLEFEGIVCLISSKLEKLCGFLKLKKWLILKPNEKIKMKGIGSRGLHLQQIMDLIYKTKTPIGQVGAHESMSSIDLTDGMTSIQLKDEIVCIKDKLSLQSSEMTNTNQRMKDIETKLTELITKITELSTIQDHVESTM